MFSTENCWLVCRTHLDRHSALSKGFSRGMDAALKRKKNKEKNRLAVPACWSVFISKWLMPF